nr:uncharacterized protein LOC114822448 [Malus domestica]
MAVVVHSFSEYKISGNLEKKSYLHHFDSRPLSYWVENQWATGSHFPKVEVWGETHANYGNEVADNIFVVREQRGMQSDTEQVPPESESMEVLLVRMLAMVRNVAVPARGSVEKLWCDDEGSMAVVLESFP